MQFWYGSLINLPKNLGKKHKTDKNILKIVICHNFEYSCRLIPTIKQKKTFAHATICNTLIISCTSNIDQSLTCPKTGGKD